MPHDFSDRPVTGAVITAFEPTSSLLDALTSVMDQVDAVVVVDDGSRSERAERILAAARDKGAVVVRHGDNRGIGAALNSGVSALDSIGSVSAILTVDQDSVIPAGYVGDLIAAGGAAESDGVPIGMVAPDVVASVDRQRGVAASENGYRIGREPIQSGLLITRRVLRKLSGFDESLFIDGVDSDFYVRARRAGLQCVVAPGTKLEHRLGREHQLSVMGREVALTVASDFRYYYQARNLVRLLRKHGRAEPAWSAHAIVRQVRHIGIVSVLVPGRFPRIVEYCRGLSDGVRGREGRRPDVQPQVPSSGTSMEDEARPTVSVCMASWNGSAYIRVQIDSILEQLGPEDELVVVDDASSDGTADLVEMVGDPRIRVIRSALNSGYVKAFEAAISASDRDVILLADQDDVWLPGRVDAMLADLRTADVVATNLATLGGEERISGPFGQRDWALRAKTSDHRVRNTIGILMGNMPYFGCAMGVRRDVLERGALPFPPFLKESHDLWLALYGNICGTMIHDERRSLARRYHDANATPDRPRSVVAAVRSRILLMRCIIVLLGRRRATVRREGS